MEIFHVDVFSKTPFGGNGLTVVFPDKETTDKEMQKIASEFKQFETIFLVKEGDSDFVARIFTTTEELDFAGHPVLGGVAMIHQLYFKENKKQSITLHLKQKDVAIVSEYCDGYYQVKMNQGIPQFIGAVSEEWKKKYCDAVSLSFDDLSEQYPMEVVTTGLPYLLIPIKQNLDKVKIKGTNFENLLEQNKAKFVYVFDVNRMEGRTFDNLGITEDVATGSAAGPMGAYLYQHGHSAKDTTIRINQGSFLNRPSVITVDLEQKTGEIYVSGEVVILAGGNLII